MPGQQQQSTLTDRAIWQTYQNLPANQHKEARLTTAEITRAFYKLSVEDQAVVNQVAKSLAATSPARRFGTKAAREFICRWMMVQMGNEA